MQSFAVQNKVYYGRCVNGEINLQNPLSLNATINTLRLVYTGTFHEPSMVILGDRCRDEM